MQLFDLKSDGYGFLCEEYKSALGLVDSWSNSLSYVVLKSFRGQKLEMIFERVIHRWHVP